MAEVNGTLISQLGTTVIDGTEMVPVEKGEGNAKVTLKEVKDFVKKDLPVPESKDGMSAYEIAVKNGFKGTEPEWLASLKGEDGVTLPDGVAVTEVIEEGEAKKKQVPSANAVAAALKNAGGGGGIAELDWKGNFPDTVGQFLPKDRKAGTVFKTFKPEDGWKVYICMINKSTSINSGIWSKEENWYCIAYQAFVNILAEFLGYESQNVQVTSNQSKYVKPVDGGFEIVTGPKSFNYTNAIPVSEGDYIEIESVRLVDILAVYCDSTTTQFFEEACAFVGANDGTTHHHSFFATKDGYITINHSGVSLVVKKHTKGLTKAIGKLSNTISILSSNLNSVETKVSTLSEEVKRVEGLSEIKKENVVFEQDYGYVRDNAVQAQGNQSFWVTKNPIAVKRGDAILVQIEKIGDTVVMCDQNKSNIGADISLDLGGNTHIAFIAEDGYVLCGGKKNMEVGFTIARMSSQYILSAFSNLDERLKALPVPNDADFDLADWQSKIYYNLLFTNVVCGGDSVTIGHCVSDVGEYEYLDNTDKQPIEKFGWPDQLEKIVNGWKVTKFAQSAIGVKGWTTRFFDKVDWPNQQLAILEFCLNDQIPTTTIEEDVNSKSNYNEYADTYWGNYCKLIEKIYEQNQYIYIVLVISAHLVGSNVVRIENAKTIARKYNLPWIDLNDKTYLAVEPSSRDHVHFTPFKYLVKANYIACAMARICESKQHDINNLIYKKVDGVPAR